MNRKLVIILVSAALVAGLLSFGIKNIIAARSARNIRKIELDITNTLYKNAKDAFSNGSYDKAIRFYEALLERLPEDEIAEDSLASLAQCYEAKKDLIKAKNTLKRFIDQFPNSGYAKGAEKKIEEINAALVTSGVITDDSFLYEIKPGDTLGKIAAQYGTTVELIKKSNNLKSDLIIPGKSIKITKGKFKIFVDKSENILVLRKADGEPIKTYTVSTGENLSTPTGTFVIEEKLVSPVWYKVGAVVKPDSPEYELGSRWMGLSVKGYGIHGTNDSSSIGKHITKGCVRMRNEDIEELYAIVPSGTEVTIAD